MNSQKTAITPTREENFPEWYQQIVKSADLAENSDVRGCMVIKPWGYGVWENIQSELDFRIKETGHSNAYFPLLIPLSFLEKEASHVEGFAKECAVVTHHRLIEKDGKLIPDGELEEPMIIRPTSETIIGASFSRWVQSYRDLPLLINQWANVFRWEMRTRVFLRTAEFLWQEGHTAHSSEQEATEEVLRMVEVYRDLLENVLAIPVIVGRKTDDERFPGAVDTYTLEAMMQDGKALQGGTSHYLGQNFSKASNIKFLNKTGEHEFAYTTSWGVSTRLIGGLIMTHSDDDGLRLPPKIAPKQIIIIPIIPKEDRRDEVLKYAERIKNELQSLIYNNQNLKIEIDKRDIRGGDKSWEWIKKGAPIRIEVGPRDIPQDNVVLYRRDSLPKEKQFLSINELTANVINYLDEIQNSYYRQALELREKNTFDNITSIAELEKFFDKGETSYSNGFVLAKWSGDPELTKKLKDLKLTIRCIPVKQRETSGPCILTGQTASLDIIIAKAY